MAREKDYTEKAYDLFSDTKWHYEMPSAESNEQIAQIAQIALLIEIRDILQELNSKSKDMTNEQ